MVCVARRPGATAAHHPVETQPAVAIAGRAALRAPVLSRAEAAAALHLTQAPPRTAVTQLFQTGARFPQ
jgi:hypothetical protein